MHNEISAHFALPSLTADQDRQLLAIKERSLTLPQVAIKTQHIIHAGMYCRSINLSAGTLIVGANIIKPTLVTICGSARLFMPDDTIDITGYAVLPGMPNRRMVLLALTDLSMSMTMRTDARTVQEAENEFTDEPEDLLSHQNQNEIIITGVT